MELFGKEKKIRIGEENRELQTNGDYHCIRHIKRDEFLYLSISVRNVQLIDRVALPPHTPHSPALKHSGFVFRIRCKFLL